MKFTDADFAEATTSISMRPEPPLRTTISYSNLRLPVAPPSPLFDGINENTETDKFPIFEDSLDIRQNVPTPIPHCILHCGHKVCMHMIKHNLYSPVCKCEWEECKPEEEKTTTSWFRPEMDLDYLAMSSIGYTIAHTDPSQEIDIHYTEVLKILAHLEDRAISLAPRKQHLTYALSCDYPGQEEEATLTAVYQIFRIIRLYFLRTLRSPDHRSISIKQLRCDLSVYRWTLFAEWVDSYCDDVTRNHLLEQQGPICVKKASFGASAAVLKFWNECIEDVLGLLVWRDEEVRWSMVESGVVFGILTLLFLWVLAVMLRGNVGSHV